MSRRSAPDSPWQNGMPPFGLCQQQFNPMMNCGPMWAQPSLHFMGGGMAADMMRFGGNVSSRSNFRRNYDQPDRYRPRQGYGERYGNRPGTFGRGDRKRPGAADRSSSPPSKRQAVRRDSGRKAEQDRTQQQGNEDEGASSQEEETTGAQDELYDPAEPTQEDVVDGAGRSEGNEGESAEAAGETSVNEEGQGGADGETAVPKDESGDTEGKDAVAEDKEGLSKTGSKAAGKPSGSGLAKPSGSGLAKPSGSGPKASEPKSPIKGQSAGRSSDKKDGTARQDQGPKKSGLKGKGWCTVCEVHFDGSFLDHRRNEEHKVKRDEKYPKCHPCSMGFNNRKQYEQHCAGDFHRKNVEVLDNEVDETAGPLGEEYLEEVRAYFCTLCKLLLKAELKSHHCCTQGHYRRHRDIKRKEEATLKAKSSKKQTEDEEEDVSQMAFTVTDEIFSDEESKAATDAAADAARQSKQEKPTKGPHEEIPQKEGPADSAKEEPSVEEQAEPAAVVKSEPLEDEHSAEAHATLEDSKQVAESDAGTAAASDEVGLEVGSVPDTNGCKNPEEEAEEQQEPAPACSVPTVPKAVAPKPATPKPPKAPLKSTPTTKAAVMTPKPAGTATKAPAAKTSTAVSSSAATSTPAVPATTATAPVKKPPTVAGTQGPAAAAGGRGGMVGGRGRGVPKAVRARKR